MEFKIKPFHKNSYPRQGVLIKSPDAKVWLLELYKMGVDPEDTFMYPLPGVTPNEIFGCLVVPKDGIRITDVGRNSYMQCLNNKLFIPENTITFPELNEIEWTKQFTADRYVMHQDIGLVELTVQIEWSLLLEMSNPGQAEIRVPLAGIYIPNTIRSYSIEADEKKLAEDIENQVGRADTAKDVPFNMDKIMKGNQREIDKLLKYLEKHPEQVLTLGIPLDILGSSRGGGGGRFVFGKTRGNLFDSESDLRTVLYVLGVVVVLLFLIFLVFNNSSSKSSAFPIFIIFLVGRFIYWFLNKRGSDTRRWNNSGRAATIADDKFAILQSRYEKLANEYVAQKEYQKAAGIYLKLLKNNFRAAQVLEEGGYYGEAGAIYLKHCKEKAHAAECFEKGKLYTQAIDIYKELGETEKVGDLYTHLKKEKEANHYYEMVAEDYIKNKQYVKASLVYRKKMKQPLKGQALLLEGWHSRLDAHNCLNNFFTNIENKDVLIREIKRFYSDDLEENRKEAFLQVIKLEFHKHESLQAPIKEIAYEIIAECIDNNPLMISELIGFNPKDKSLSKDVMKFKASKMRKD